MRQEFALAPRPARCWRWMPVVALILALATGASSPSFSMQPQVTPDTAEDSWDRLMKQEGLGVFGVSGLVLNCPRTDFKVVLKRQGQTTTLDTPAVRSNPDGTKQISFFSTLPIEAGHYDYSIQAPASCPQPAVCRGRCDKNGKGTADVGGLDLVNSPLMFVYAFGEKELSIMTKLFEEALSDQVKGIDVWLDNNRQGPSTVTLPGQPPRSFPIEVFEQDIPLAPLTGWGGNLGVARFHVNRIASRRADVAYVPAERTFQLRIRFEEDDREIKGYFSANGMRFDDLVPDADVSQFEVTVHIKPYAFGGALGMPAFRAETPMVVQARGVCDLNGWDLCDLLTSYKETVKARVRGGFLGAFNDAEAQATLGRTIATKLENLYRIHMVYVTDVEIVTKTPPGGAPEDYITIHYIGYKLIQAPHPHPPGGGGTSHP